MQYGKNHNVGISARAAGVVIFDPIGRILLVKEEEGDKRGYWHIPSGSVEQGEQLEAAAKREVFEETGLKIRLDAYLNTYVGKFDDGEFVLRHVWVAQLPSEQRVDPVNVEEVSEARFFSDSEIGELYRTDQLRMYHTLLMIEDAFGYRR